MDRRQFLTTTGAAAAATATATTSEALAQDPTLRRSEISAPGIFSGAKELRLATAWGDGVSGHADQAYRLAQRIADMSGGRYRIAVLPGVADGLGAVRSGAADLYHGTESAHLDAHRALAYFAGLPGDRGLAPHYHLAWMLVGGGQALWDDLAADFDVKAMIAGHTGCCCSFVATRRITAMSELAGAKVAVEGLARDVVRGFGLEPVAVDEKDLAAAMAEGALLAAERGGAIPTHALGLPAAAPYAVGTSINRHGFALSLGVRRSLWERLPAGDQAIFTAAAAAETQLALAEDTAHRRLLPEAPASHTWPLAHELDRAIARVADAVVAHVAASDATAQRINAAYVAFRRIALGEEAAAV